jgi:HTH-type transcriptional regulator, glycine betaine synthesis regulator
MPTAPSSPSPSRPAEAELEVADTVGQLMEFWGFKRPMGRIWTLLYLSPEPIGAAEIGEELRMSAGAVSMALSELVKWGAVRKTWRPGERRDYYEAETGIGRLVQRVLRERELVLVQKFGEALETAENTLSAQSAQSESDEATTFKRARLKQLGDLAKLGESLLGALVSGEAVDPAPLLGLSRSVNR